ncbi:MAG: radical SAM protein [Victivallaceae bacterium]
MGYSLNKLAVLVGYKCNFRCAHCGVADKKRQELTEVEIRLLRRLLASRHFESLLFIGGEPTLYINKINEVLDGLPQDSDPRVLITTNGHFAKSENSAIETLKKFSKLNSVQLSYDNFHKTFIHLSNVRNLSQACKRLNMGFVVMIAIQSPLDLVLLKELKSVGIDDKQVLIQGVHAIGSAATNHIAYSYPSFDRGVLRKKCPNKEKLIYMCGEGFTTCCSQLTLGEDTKDYIHPSMERHTASKFHSLIRRFSFKELMGKAGLSVKDLAPKHSYPCTLCGLIFDTIKENRPSLLH